MYISTYLAKEGVCRPMDLNGKTILHYTAYDDLPGAAKSAFNIHNAMLSYGAESKMVVYKKRSQNASIHQVKSGIFGAIQTLIFHIASIYSGKSNQKKLINSNSRKYINISSLKPYNKNDVDVIFVYWINDFINTTLQRKIYSYYKCPIVWVLMDMEPITGGCHQSMGCQRYRVACGKCMVLNSKRKNDITHRTWKKKKKLSDSFHMIYVAPTKGLLDQVEKSSIAKNNTIAYIPLAVETDVYKPVKMESARDVLNISYDKIVMCYGANNIQSIYKGSSYLEEALAILYVRLQESGRYETINRLVLLLAGGNRGSAFQRIPFEVSYIGHCRDTRTMALMFQSSDMFLCPSIFDGGPVMIPEAMMCGTPVVAFRTGGATDLIESGVNGYIAEYGNTDDFANGILCLIETTCTTSIRTNARKAAKNCNTPEKVAEEYCKMLNNILK